MTKDPSVEQGYEIGLAAFSNYAVACCDIAHDLNNPLAIVKGYAEEFAEILQAFEASSTSTPVVFSKTPQFERLKKIHSKISSGSSRMEILLKEVAHQRKSTVPLSETFLAGKWAAQWLKILAPALSLSNVRLSVGSIVSTSSFQANKNDLSLKMFELWKNWLAQLKFDELTDVEVRTVETEKGFRLNFCFQEKVKISLPTLPHLKLFWSEPDKVVSVEFEVRKINSTEKGNTI
jgi:hypothetical protein